MLRLLNLWIKTSNSKAPSIINHNCCANKKRKRKPLLWPECLLRMSKVFWIQPKQLFKNNNNSLCIARYLCIIYFLGLPFFNSSKTRRFNIFRGKTNILFSILVGIIRIPCHLFEFDLPLKRISSKNFNNFISFLSIRWLLR